MRSIIALENIPLLSDLSPARINVFAQLLTTETFAPGDYILRAGDNSAKVFIVRSGLVRVCLPSEAFSKNAMPQCAALLSVEGEGGSLGRN